ncbi:MAG: VOC family protein [Deltaproteobacteria bacterium]|nr:VOC family protein [Deltaproteobacteria bacterium]
MPNPVCHFAIYADDLERAMGFYQGVFGWTFEAWGPPDFYLVQTGSEGAGVHMGSLDRRREPLAEGGANAYRCTISVEVVEEIAAAIEAHGGTLRSPVVEIPSVGRVVEFADTEGNIVCAMTYTLPAEG